MPCCKAILKSNSEISESVTAGPFVSDEVPQGENDPCRSILLSISVLMTNSRRKLFLFPVGPAAKKVLPLPPPAGRWWYSFGPWDQNLRRPEVP